MLNLKNNPVQAACIILAAGNSERMKINKALLRFSEKENFLQHITNVYNAVGIKNVIAVANSKLIQSLQNFKNIILVENKNTELGRIHSLKCGLKTIRNYNFCFIQNVDNPLISKEIISSLWNCRNDADYISPYSKGKGGHPVLISKKVITFINSMHEINLRLDEVLNQFTNKSVEIDDPKFYLNINSPEDYSSAFQTKSI